MTARRAPDAPDGAFPPYLRTPPRAPRGSLRERLSAGVLVLPGVVDVLAARIAEQVGYEACYVTGAGVSNAQFGMADLGFTGLSDLVTTVYRLAGAVGIPLVVDADTGYGNAVSVMHAVAELERAGAAAVQIEDQVFPKRCGHFDRKLVVATDEMEQKIHAAVRARSDRDLLVIARTDALAVLGFDAAVERAKRYRDAGADVIFIEAPEDDDQLERIPRLLDGVPVMANVVDGGLTPVRSVRELERMGYAIVLYANVALRASIAAVRGVLADLRDTGDSRRIADRIATWQERQDLVYLSGVERIEDELARSVVPPPAGMSRGNDGA